MELILITTGLFVPGDFGLFQLIPFFHTVVDAFRSWSLRSATYTNASAAYFYASQFKFGGWPLLSRFSLCVCNLPIRHLFFFAAHFICGGRFLAGVFVRCPLRRGVRLFLRISTQYFWDCLSYAANSLHSGLGSVCGLVSLTWLLVLAGLSF